MFGTGGGFAARGGLTPTASGGGMSGAPDTQSGGAVPTGTSAFGQQLAGASSVPPPNSAQGVFTSPPDCYYFLQGTCTKVRSVARVAESLG